MKVTRLAILTVALAAGGLAAMMAVRMRPPPPVVVARSEAPTAEVLVASSDLPRGSVLAGTELGWQKWPKDAVNAQFITREARPNAAEELKGAIVRTGFLGGEPIRQQQLVLGSKGGFMAAILTPGMRAVSTEISPETGAGGFILPHDKVDVILTRREQGARQPFQSETILRDIRVLAIDQTLGEKNGEKVVVGRTATLEVTPRQAEILALSRQLGTLQLTLRALTDQDLAGDVPAEGRSVTLVRFGIVSQSR